MLAVILIAATQAPVITYESVAVRLETALKEISAQAGQNLTTSPATRDEFVVLRLDKAPLGEVLDRIAAATASEWQTEKDGRRLIRSANLIREQDALHFKQVATKFATAQAKVRDQLQKDGVFDEAKARNLANQIDSLVQEAKGNRGQLRNWEAQQRVNSSMPGGRLARHLMSVLDPNALARIESPGRVVFSTAPNPMQQALPRAAWDVIRAYAKERALIRPLLEHFGTEYVDGAPQALYELGRSSTLRDQTPAKVLVQATRHDMGNSVAIQVWVANQAGQVIEGAYSSLAAELFQNPRPTPLPPDPTGAAPIELSDRSRAMAQVLQTVFARGGDPETMPPLPDAVKPILLQPEEHSLAELFLSDLLIGAAKAKGLNMVAAVSDLSGLFVLMQFGGAAPTVNQFFERMKDPQFDFFLEESPGWLVGRRLDPTVDRLRKVDRAALGRLVRAAATNGKLKLEEMAAFAVTVPETVDRTSILLHLMLTSPKVGRDFERSPFNVLRFHGSLSSVQRRSLEAGEKIPYGLLTPYQQRIFHRMVFWDTEGGSRTVRSEAPRAPGDEEFQGESLRWQPTERFPNGVPGLAVVSLDLRSGPTILARGTFGQYPSSNELEPYALANYLWRRENPATQPSGEQTVYTEFSSVEQTSYRYQFEPDPQMAFGGELKDVFERSSPVTSPDRLPASVWAKVQAALEELRKRARPPEPGAREPWGPRIR